jgi:bifunctional non-homologous end joining protein LigD
MTEASARPVVGGVAVSHPDRIVFPAAGATKLDLARYYDAIADTMLPHVVDRPLTLVHCPNGVPARGAVKGRDCFYLRHSKAWSPVPLRRVRIREKTKTGEYLIIDDARGLIGLAQMNALEIHTWNSRTARLEQPDRIVIDLDPGERLGWPAVVDGARVVKRLLEGLDLASFVKTTGGRGVHIVVPLTPKADWAECLAFARALAEALARREPDVFTADFRKAGRDRQILIDYLRNNRTNTSIAAFSTRARPEATVSVPIGWRELPRASPDRFTIRTVLARAAARTRDPWRSYWTTRQTIAPTATRALARL